MPKPSPLELESLPFLSRDETMSKIRAVGAADSLTIYVGAGLAKDRGSPDWRILVQEMLQKVLGERLKDRGKDGRKGPKSAANAAAFTETCATALTALLSEAIPEPLLLASVVDHEMGNQLRSDRLSDWIKDVLRSPVNPAGALAAGVALLALTLKMQGKPITLITTNYDSALEAVLVDLIQTRSEFAWITVRPTCDEATENFFEPSDLPVFHVHGMVDAERLVKDSVQPFDLSPPVFCEHEYVDMRGGWQEDLLISKLRTDTCLFVGASLTDPYLSYCLRKAQEAKSEPLSAVAVFPLQGEKWPLLWKETSPKVRETIPLSEVAEIVAGRLRHFGVSVLWADFYSQVGQFCFEAALYGQVLEERYENEMRYGLRLRRWEEEWHRQPRGVSSDLAPATARALLLQQNLLEAKKQILKLQGLGTIRNTKVELWARRTEPNNDHSRALYLCASSEAATVAFDVAHTSPISIDSRYLSTRTFIEGRAQGPRLRGIDMGRWKRAISAPIWLDAQPWHHLPVGVMIFASLDDDFNPDVAKRFEVAKMLTEAGERLLTPASS